MIPAGRSRMEKRALPCVSVAAGPASGLNVVVDKDWMRWMIRALRTAPRDFGS